MNDSAEARAVVEALLLGGHTHTSAAHALGVPRAQISEIARRAGWSRFAGRPPRPRWTRDTALPSLQNWLVAHDGQQPRRTDWQAGGGRPSAYTLRILFGSWGAAWRAANPVVPPRLPGPPRRGTP